MNTGRTSWKTRWSRRTSPSTRPSGISILNTPNISLDWTHQTYQTISHLNTPISERRVMQRKYQQEKVDGCRHVPGASRCRGHEEEVWTLWCSLLCGKGKIFGFSEYGRWNIFVWMQIAVNMSGPRRSRTALFERVSQVETHLKNHWKVKTNEQLWRVT